MKKWAIRLFVGAALLSVAGVAIAWFALRASLPQLDGEIVVDGLSAPATLVRDAAGIPTITASNREDLAFATGFAHGQDRFFQMDLIRRQSAGELSELFGEVAVEVDKRHRFHRFRDRAIAALRLAPDEDISLVERYAAGVNAGLQSLGAHPFEYLLLGAEPRPWRAEDSLLVLYTMFMQLNDARASGDVQRGYVHGNVPAEVYAWLYPEGTSWDAPIMGDVRPSAPLPSADVWSVRDTTESAPASTEVGKPYLNGSNNWVVGGALTSNGRALMSNDMHLGHAVPNVWYQARLIVDPAVGTSDSGSDAEQARDVTGVTLPGSPFVSAGSNGSMAWGYTNSYGDWSDAVLLRPGSTPGTYRTPDGDKAFEVHRETIEVKGADPVIYEIRETVWGPVDDLVDYPEGEIAVSWIAHSPEAVNLRLVELETAETLEEALAVANRMGIPPQNFVSGDAAGNIAWTIAGQIPVKNGYDPMIPADWSVEHGWLGWLHPDDYPRVVNPPDHRIWTANARVADGEALSIIGDGGYDLGARAAQIRDGLLEKDTFEPEDMLDIQYDDRALFLTRWRDLVLTVLDETTVEMDPELAEYRRLVESWIPRAAPESVGYRLVRAFRLEVQSRVFHGVTAPIRDIVGDDVTLRLSNQFEGSLWSLMTQRSLHLLPGSYEDWDALLLAAVRANIAMFDEQYEGSLSDRNWGEFNTASIQHPLSRAIPALSGFLDMPSEPLNGDVDLPKAQGPRFGASERFSVAPGDEENGLMQMPTGQSGHPLSDFYRQGHDDWVKGRPSPFLPDESLYELQLIPDT